MAEKGKKAREKEINETGRSKTHLPGRGRNVNKEKQEWHGRTLGRLLLRIVKIRKT